jgi:hypothetical protein
VVLTARREHPRSPVHPGLVFEMALRMDQSPWLGLTRSVVAALAVGASSAAAQERCDTLHGRVRHGIDSTVGALPPRADAAGGRAVAAGPGGARRDGRVRKDARSLAAGERVAKDRGDRLAVRKDRAFCPVLSAVGGEVGPVQPVFDTPQANVATGEVAERLPLPGALAGPRGFFVPPLIGGIILGGGAIAVANRPRAGTPSDTLAVLPPVVQPPPPPGNPETPGTVVPEPSTMLLLAAGGAVLAGMARRRA